MKTYGYEVAIWCNGVPLETVKLALISWGTDNDLSNGQMFTARAVIFSSMHDGEVVELPDSCGELLYSAARRHFANILTPDEESQLQIACHKAVGALADEGIAPPARCTYLWRE